MIPGHTLGEALAAGRRRLQDASPTPGSDARRLLEGASGASGSELRAFPERPLAPHARQCYAAWIESRRTGVPVAYLLGGCGFHAIDLQIDERVLVPRPETEILVDLAIDALPRGGHLLEFGTGSGAIALAVAHARCDVRVLATDRSPGALAVARANRDALGLGDRVVLLAGNWGRALLPAGPDRFDLTVSNPPYVEADAPEWNGPLHHEPEAALLAGADGLDAIRALLPDARRSTVPGGWIALEHGAAQHGRVARLMARHGLRSVHGIRDLSGHDRVTLGQRPEPMP